VVISRIAKLPCNFAVSTSKAFNLLSGLSRQGVAIKSENKFCSCGSGFQLRFDRGKMPLPHKNKATYLSGNQNQN
jgi:hypothetical protein